MILIIIFHRRHVLFYTPRNDEPNIHTPSPFMELKVRSALYENEFPFILSLHRDVLSFVAIKNICQLTI